ncbi:hypothetical protein DPX16_5378 [Anabarilius grahami]|uniref:Uncharacterized protein n=1 Tax=Anabarilius grahami TaxID=495550 RepID=A0A3N0Y529_ANAGA|nr:hypothetical protein DPX16_5378 [Anabarilius grahami]
MLAWKADAWTITLHASGEFTNIEFYPVCNNPLAECVETSISESGSDDEEPGPSHLDNNTQAFIIQHHLERHPKMMISLNHLAWSTTVMLDLKDPEHLLAMLR